MYLLVVYAVHCVVLGVVLVMVVCYVLCTLCITVIFIGYVVCTMCSISCSYWLCTLYIM